MRDPAKLIGATVAERITAAMAYAEMKPAELARAIGVSRAIVSQWQSGLVKKLAAENLLNIEAATGVSARWLESGEPPAENLQIKYRIAPQQLELLRAAEQLNEYELEQAIRLLRAIPGKK